MRQCRVGQEAATWGQWFNTEKAQEVELIEGSGVSKEKTTERENL